MAAQSKPQAQSVLLNLLQTLTSDQLESLTQLVQAVETEAAQPVIKANETTPAPDLSTVGRPVGSTRGAGNMSKRRVNSFMAFRSQFPRNLSKHNSLTLDRVLQHCLHRCHTDVQECACQHDMGGRKQKSHVCVVG
jgi:hypothetical protein